MKYNTLIKVVADILKFNRFEKQHLESIPKLTHEKSLRESFGGVTDPIHYIFLIMSLKTVYNREFIAALDRLNKNGEGNLILEKLDKYYESVENGRDLFYSEAKQPIEFKLKYDAESTLYALQISEELGIIVSLDDDPLFNQTIFTLYDIVPKDQLDEAYQKIDTILLILNNIFP